MAELYSSDSVREDAIFGERLEGREAIASFAESFFAGYPGVQWSLSLGFAEGRGDAPTTGGVYVIKVNGLDGQSCEVQAAVLLAPVSSDALNRTPGSGSIIESGQNSFILLSQAPQKCHSANLAAPARSLGACS